MPNDPTERLLNGVPVPLTQAESDQLAAEEAAFEARPVLPEQVQRERERRLAEGFDFDFGDARGVHHIGTSKQDMVGWDEVTMMSQAAISVGAPTTEIAIVTETGPATVTALEWQSILLAAAQARQPIWAGSFALQAMDPIPADFRDDAYWQ